MKIIDIEKLKQIIADIELQHPYKQKGNSDSYSDYNQGWSDALDTLQTTIEKL